MKISIKIFLILSAASAIITANAAFSFAGETLVYRQFKLDRATCYSAISYKETGKTVVVAVSAIAFGKGADFRKWDVNYIKIHEGGTVIRPDSFDKFYVKKESIFRIPAAVLFAALGTQVDYGGSGLTKGITAAGMAIGLGLLVLQADGDIAGEKAIFKLDEQASGRLFDGNNFIEIKIENTEKHQEDYIKIGIAKPVPRTDNNEIYERMTRDDLMNLITAMGDKVKKLEADQSQFKYGSDPQFDKIGSQIEDLESKRAAAYKIWYEKEAYK